MTQRPQDLVVCHVALPTPLRTTFDYLPPSGQAADSVPAGTRVRVTFGRRRLVGIVTGHGAAPRIESSRLRPVLEILDATPLLDRDLMRLLEWASQYYRHPLGEVISAALPARLREGADARPQGAAVWKARKDTGEGRHSLNRAPRQSALYDLLRQHPDGIELTRLKTMFPRCQAPLRALARKGLARSETRPCLDMQGSGHHEPETVVLNAHQQQATTELLGDLQRFNATLLYGVTGSGKTEVYLEVIARIVAQGRQALVLVPEIGLTPQLVSRFAQRLGAPMVVLHSGLNDTRRHCAWRMARDGTAQVVIGTRSAVFVPLARPGLIVVDEEHDTSYKQQDGFRYNARDLAVYRARLHGIPALLGSATPSLESLRNVRCGKYRSISLPERTGAATHPSFQLIDLRRMRTQDGISIPLRGRIDHHLAQGGQVLLFLNRRGFAPALICDGCGWVAPCGRCDAVLTLHAGIRRLRCHHCGTEQGIPCACPECGSAGLVPVGHGTERVEQALRRWYPETPMVRIDRDTTRRQGTLERQLADIRSGHYRILLGTQMLSKGHDFPDVSLVGILDVDSGLYSTDFRATERLAQLVIQVAGRAGRADRPGEVCLQTHDPEHPLLQTVIHRGYTHFAQAALEERAATGLPPFRHLALLRAEAQAREAPMGLLELARERLCEQTAAGAQILGPAPAPMERRAGRFRAQMMLIGAQRHDLESLMDSCLDLLERHRDARRVRWSLDVDPVDLY